MYKRASVIAIENSDEINDVLNADGSSSSELTLGADLMVTDSAAKSRAADRRKSYPSKNSVSEGSTGRPLIRDCINDLESVWLNELARKAYKKLKSTQVEK